MEKPGDCRGNKGLGILWVGYSKNPKEFKTGVVEDGKTEATHSDWESRKTSTWTDEGRRQPWTFYTHTMVRR